MALKLGKKPAQFDQRDLPLKAMIQAAVIPPEYDFDLAHPGLNYPMFANDQYGCCVIAGRAHQTMRFELIEQKSLLSIGDRDVLNEYFKQTGGVDSGLVVSDSLRLWRRRGWIACNRRYYARGYARINHRVQNEVRTAIYADVGVGIGFRVTEAAMRQFEAGEDWDLVPDEGADCGGHYVYIPAYHSDGSFTCVTWGKRQRMTSRFFARYVDEAWAVFDEQNKKAGILDFSKLDLFLSQL